MIKARLALLTASGLVALVLTVPSALSFSDRAKKGKAATSAKGSVAEGESLYKKNCEMCHFPDKADKKLGPGLKGLFKSKELPESHKPATDATVREKIEKGSPDAKPVGMPGFAGKLTPQELDSLMAYLKTL